MKKLRWWIFCRVFSRESSELIVLRDKVAKLKLSNNGLSKANKKLRAKFEL